MFHPSYGLEGTEEILIPVLVYAHSFQHPGQLALQDGNRGFQLMGGGGEKCHPLTVQLPLLLHFRPEGFIGGFQLGQGGGKTFRQLIEALTQGTDFIPASFRALPGEIQLRHLSRNGTDAKNGTCNKAGVEKCA